MRFDIHKVRTYLINELSAVPGVVANIQHDGSDLVIAELVTGETVIMHLVERLMPLSEIKTTLAEDNAAMRHTLFILWGDMLLPPENRVYLPDDWMEALYTLYDGKIYGYDSYAQYTSVFPVYFEDHGQGFQRYIRYGTAINVAHLRADFIRTDQRHISGFWRVADFEPPASKEARQEAQQRVRLSADRNTMAAYYAMLKIAQGADRQTVRRAYRKLARQYHPDLNRATEAKEQMQQINEAYRRIMQQLGDEG